MLKASLRRVVLCFSPRKASAQRLDIRQHDHIDLPGCRAVWENMTALNGTERSWINYHITDEHDIASPAFRPVVREDSPAVHGSYGWLTTDQGWHQYASWYRGHSYNPSALCPSPTPEFSIRRTVRLRGLLANCLTEFNSAFGHTQREAAFRFFFLHEAGVLERCHTILVHKNLARLISRHQPELAGEYGDRFVFGDAGVRYLPEAVVTVAHPSCSMNASERQLRVLRRHLVEESVAMPGALPEKVFIPRSPTATRTLVNYAEVYQLMTSLGYAPVDCGAVPNPSRLLAQARIVVGSHGSNLCDADFLASSSALLELFPENHFKPYHYNACRLTGARYGFILGRVATATGRFHGPAFDNYYLDPATLRRCVLEFEECLAK
jgi:hypothetical protein